MASYFRESRNVELSTLEYLETELLASWSSVTVVKTFKSAYSATVKLPIICVRLSDSDITRREIGNTALDTIFTVLIDVFAKSDAQRLDLADFLNQTLKDSWDYKEYSHVSGNNKQIIGTPNGKCFVSTWGANRKIDTFNNDEVKDRYRHLITLDIRKNMV